MPDQPTSRSAVDPVSADIAAALQTRAAQLEVVLDNIADVVYLVDVLPDGFRFAAVNARFLEATGLALEEVIGQRVEDVIPEPSLSLVLARYAQAIADRAPVYWEEETRYPAGTKVGEVMVAPVLEGNDGTCAQLVGTVHDITLRREHEQQLHELAHFDALTGLPNRRHFYASLERRLAAAHARNAAVAVLYLDVDRFKHVNDVHGHAAGDALLQRVAERILHCVRARDLVGRLGGDEFAITADIEPAPGAAAALARQLVDAMQRPFALAEVAVRSTVSIGIAICPEDAFDAGTLMRYADTAMYHAKAEGRNAYRFYTPRMNEAERERREMEAALRHAIDHGAFVLHYQPQVDLRSGDWIGAEALLRWTRPGHGMVSPCDFIPVLEQTGLIVPVGRWVIAEACRQLAAWRAIGLDGLAMSVNVSARQLPPESRRDAEPGVRTPSFAGDDGLCAHVDACLREHAVPRGALELELTESTLMADPENAAVLLGRLKALDVCIQVDDFGTGYSSLAYLKRFPIDALKIDRAFIQGLGVDEEDSTIARAIIALARSLNLRVIAEGVEREAQRDFLLRERCERAQGYFFARPMPAEDFARELGTCRLRAAR